MRLTKKKVGLLVGLGIVVAIMIGTVYCNKEQLIDLEYENSNLYVEKTEENELKYEVDTLRLSDSKEDTVINVKDIVKNDKMIYLSFDKDIVTIQYNGVTEDKEYVITFELYNQYGSTESLLSIPKEFEEYVETEEYNELLKVKDVGRNYKLKFQAIGYDIDKDKLMDFYDSVVNNIVLCVPYTGEMGYNMHIGKLGVIDSLKLFYSDIKTVIPNDNVIKIGSKEDREYKTKLFIAMINNQYLLNSSENLVEYEKYDEVYKDKDFNDKVSFGYQSYAINDGNNLWTFKVHENIEASSIEDRLFESLLSK